MTDEAVAHLEVIGAYVSALDRGAATRLAERLVAVADSLAVFSERGHEAASGTREMSIVWPYILRYRVEENSVIILRIRHGAQQESGGD